MSTTEVEKAAARGAKWLDKKLPGWFTVDKINVSKLDMGNGQCEKPRACGCVCAQLDAAYLAASGDESRFGAWWADAFRRIGHFRDSTSIMDRAQKLGFMALRIEEYGDLTKAWAREIRQRRAAAKKAA